ncbi:STAS domain-containing protein [Evansella clarkii]|uniref:STAS domain-containing protein n=1 Tax=Evansella clarkii TaxID=79879 RepID=UPI000B450185|nr:STAS domain-containing protein [Evansella clarkii]
MHRNKELYDFLLDHAEEITEEWYRTLEKNDPSGVYISEDPDVINNVKRQNYEFHLAFFKIFVTDKEEFLSNLEKWIGEVAQDEEHLNTPLHRILKEFYRTQEMYISRIDQFVEERQDKYTIKEITSWYQIVDLTMFKILVRFTEEHTNYSQKRFQKQQELILELSSPIITLNEQVALLPLVGEVDESRAKIILEKTLEECSRLGVNHLLLDLSGVAVMDKIVARELGQLIDALKLVGVETTLSGLRPEIAQSAVQLGLNFGKVSIKPSLSNTIKVMELSL